jgi:hypothetical protein
MGMGMALMLTVDPLPGPRGEPSPRRRRAARSARVPQATGGGVAGAAPADDSARDRQQAGSDVGCV